MLTGGIDLSVGVRRLDVRVPGRLAGGRLRAVAVRRRGAPDRHLGRPDHRPGRRRLPRPPADHVPRHGPGRVRVRQRLAADPGPVGRWRAPRLPLDRLGEPDLRRRGRQHPAADPGEPAAVRAARGDHPVRPAPHRVRAAAVRHRRQPDRGPAVRRAVMAGAAGPVRDLRVHGGDRRVPALGRRERRVGDPRRFAMSCRRSPQRSSGARRSWAAAAATAARSSGR